MSTKKISIALTGYIRNSQDGSASVVLINNDVWDKIDFDRIDQRFEGDVFDIELVVDEDGNILEGLDVVTESDVDNFKQDEYDDYDPDND
jgi:hypothetical protein